jgi:hypothetical protein
MEREIWRRVRWEQSSRRGGERDLGTESDGREIYGGIQTGQSSRRGDRWGENLGNYSDGNRVQLGETDGDRVLGEKSDEDRTLGEESDGDRSRSIRQHIYYRHLRIQKAFSIILLWHFVPFTAML